MTEDEMVGWHHQLYGHEFQQTPGDGERQGSLMCCSPWGSKELDTTEPLNNSQGHMPGNAGSSVSDGGKEEMTDRSLGEGQEMYTLPLKEKEGL